MSYSVAGASLFTTLFALGSIAFASEQKKNCGPAPLGGYLDETCKIVLVPPPDFTKKKLSAAHTLRLKGANGFESIEFNRVVSATLRLFPGPQDAGKKTKEIVFQGKELEHFLDRVKFDTPEEPDGVPASMITGELHLSYKHNELRAIIDREFKIHNGRLLNDASAPSVYYRTKKEIEYGNYSETNSKTLESKASFMAKTKRLEIPFQIHSQAGKIDISIVENNNPELWGFEILYGKKKTDLSEIKGFPICTASVQYSGKGYHANSAWIQFITYKTSDDKSETVLLDRPPQLSDSKMPYFSWGLLPTLFDAPAMLSEDGSKKSGVEWVADSFLVASPDGLISKTIVPLASFSWGYKTTIDRKVQILEPKDTHLKDWKRFMPILSKQFSDWKFE